MKRPKSKFSTFNFDQLSAARKELEKKYDELTKKDTISSNQAWQYALSEIKAKHSILQLITPKDLWDYGYSIFSKIEPHVKRTPSYWIRLYYEADTPEKIAEMYRETTEYIYGDFH